MYRFAGGRCLQSGPFNLENSGKSLSRRHLIPPITLSVPPSPPTGVVDWCPPPNVVSVDGPLGTGWSWYTATRDNDAMTGSVIHAV